MRAQPTAIPDVLLVETPVYRDDRGWFTESWNPAKIDHPLGRTPFVQDNLSMSRRGALRGMHYQSPSAQGKLVRAVAGAVFDVAVDLRRGSPTFGRWVGATLSEENLRALWIPVGFAHGFLTLSGRACVAYKITAHHAPHAEHTLAWDDPDVGIQWPLDPAVELLISARDRSGARLADVVTFP
jgi:dTDP-4-dehydrorhamnose 3,5-epimerase